MVRLVEEEQVNENVSEHSLGGLEVAQTTVAPAKTGTFRRKITKPRSY